MDSKDTPRRGARKPALFLLASTCILSVLGVVVASTIFYLWEFSSMEFYISFFMASFFLTVAIYAALRTVIQIYAPGVSVVADKIEMGLFPFLIVEEVVEGLVVKLVWGKK